MSRKHNIRWQQSDSEDLRKAVKNFNAKISRLEKKNPEQKNALPERVSVRQMKELIDTRQDLKRELNSLRRFTERGSEELVDVPDNDYNLQMTKWQKNEMSRRVGVINRKRNKRLKEINEVEATSRGEKLGYKANAVGMGKADEVALNPMKAFTSKMTRKDLNKKFRNIMKESQSSYWNAKELQMLENFKTSILYNFAEDDVEEIINAIDSMDFKEFYRTWQAEGGNFETAYPPDREQYEAYLEGLRATWIPNR